MSSKTQKKTKQEINPEDYGHLNYVFNVKDALEFDVFAAILLQNLRFWLRKNKAEYKHIENDRVWSYNTAEALAELFPWVSVSTVERTIRKLKESGLLLVDCLSGDKFNKTNWFSLNEEEFLIRENQEKIASSAVNADTVNLTASSPSDQRYVKDIKQEDIKPYINTKDNNTSLVADADASDNAQKETLPVKRLDSVIRSENGKHWGTAIDLQIAEHIACAVAALSGDDQKSNLAVWANDIRLMRERDKREPEHIIALFKWAHHDSFWSSNILSPKKLRQKWTQLAAKRNAQKNAPSRLYSASYSNTTNSQPGWLSGFDEIF